MTQNKIEALIDELIAAEIIWCGDRGTAINCLAAGKSWSTGIKDDKDVWANAEAIADSHGFTCKVDDSASSIDFILRPGTPKKA